MSAYWIVGVNVTDPEAYEEYKKRTPEALAKYGGKFLARGGRTNWLEGEDQYSRVVLVEFPTFEQAVTCYHSPEYKEAMSFRKRAARAQVVVLEGV